MFGLTTAEFLTEFVTFFTANMAPLVIAGVILGAGSWLGRYLWRGLRG